MLWSTNIGGYSVKQLFFHIARVAFRFKIPEWNAGDALFCVHHPKNHVRYETGSVRGHPFCVRYETGSVRGYPFCVRYQTGSVGVHPFSVRCQTGSVRVHPFSVASQTGSVRVHPFSVGRQTGSVGVQPFCVRLQTACARVRNFCVAILKPFICVHSLACLKAISPVIIPIFDAQLPIYKVREKPMPVMAQTSFAAVSTVYKQWQPWMFVRD
jgi:hypothetical protein